MRKDKRKSSNKENGNLRIEKDKNKHIFLKVVKETNGKSNAYTSNKYHLLKKEVKMRISCRIDGWFCSHPLK